MARYAMRALAIPFVLLSAQPLLAQRPEGPSPLKADSAIRTTRIERRVLESIVFEAEPRSFQVVRVPVPQPIRGVPGTTWDIEPAGAFALVGARHGELPGDIETPDLLVTVRIPAEARAGSHMAAHAIFRSASEEIDVPIETRVKPVYSIRLSVENEIEGIRIGEHVELHAAIANEGNTTDTIRVTVETPESWHAEQRDTMVVVASHETAHKLIRFTVPKNSGTGSFFVRTTAASHGDTLSALTTLSVGNSPAYEAPPGPMVRVGVGGVGVQDGESATMAQLAVSGPLTSSIQIDSRIATRPASNASAIRGLARVGAYVTEPHLAAWTSTWRVGLGSTVADFNDVMGVNAGGRGATFGYDDQTNALHVTAAKPVTGGDGERGSIFGVDFARRIGTMSVGGGVSRLDARGFGDQALTAAGVNGHALLHHDVAIEGALAYRDYDGGAGLGWIAGVTGDAFRTHGQLRIVHAAGGSSAFARAENEIVAGTLTQVDKRLSIAAALFHTSDTDVGANDVHSTLLSLSPVYRFNETMSAHAELRSSSFEVAGNPFGFSNDELHFGAGAAALIGKITYSTEAGVSRLTRGVLTTALDASESGARLTWRGMASRPLGFGVVQIESSYEHNARNTGFVPEQLTLTLRVDRAQLPRISRDLYLDAEIGYNRWSGIRSFTSLRAGASWQATPETEISANIEHNPLLFTADTRTPFVVALRVERSFGLPRIVTGRAAGIVFQDYDGDGERDADEPGMPNIAVRRGDSHATTDSEGRYRFWEQGRGATIVDVTSLPYGWVVNEKSADGLIALTPITRVEVVLQPGAAERLRNVDLSRVAVTARDDEGRVWIARRTGAQLAVFEALPVGTYEIGIDAAALAEPLKVDGVNPRITITRESVKRINLPVAGRPLRFKTDTP